MLRSPLRIGAAGALIALLGACTALPPMPERAASMAPTNTSGTALGRAIAPQAAAHPGLTGILALPNGREAFAARHRLSGAAQRSIDVQYYIWRADTSGKLLAHALWQAADRAVRVRILLDDGNTGGLDGILAVLDSHPNIEVRLFNPFMHRDSRLANFAGDFARLNRRMHNKLWVVDNQVAVVGGRNIGDEYLGAENAVEFADLDVVATGAVVADVSASFDAYWSSASAFPLAGIVAPAPQGAATTAAASWDQLEDSPEARAYLDAVRSSVADPARLAAGGLQEWALASMLSDDPSKILYPDDRSDLHMLPRLLQKLSGAQRELVLVSPYFVPTRQGTDALVQIAQRGVRVSVLTNSLASTDVTPAYSGYARYRKDLLRAGVQLWELKPTRARQKSGDKEDKEARRTVGGSSGASLHAKTFAVDRERIFVGSFNLDPRSSRLNTESGLIVESAALAGRLSDAFITDIPQRAYEVKLDEGGEGLVWIEREGATQVRHTSAPLSGPLRRAWSGILGWLPIEWLL